MKSCEEKLGFDSHSLCMWSVSCIPVSLSAPAPPCMFSLLTFHLPAPFSCMCLLCHFHPVPVFFLFLSFCHLHCFSVLSFPSSSPSLILPVILQHFPPFLSHFHSLCTAFFLLLVLLPPTHTFAPTPSFLSIPFFLLLSSTPSYSNLSWDLLPRGVADACLPGFWGAAGVCNDHGKTYALYAITVFRRNPDGSEDCWKTYRRYSDFHDFHMRITEQVCVGGS